MHIHVKQRLKSHHIFVQDKTADNFHFILYYIFTLVYTTSSGLHWVQDATHIKQGLKSHHAFVQDKTADEREHTSKVKAVCDQIAKTFVILET